MDVVTIGWLTMDDIVLTDGTCHLGVIGGGALYSAVGARMAAGAVGIHSLCGRPHADRVRREIADRGIDAQGIGIIEENGLELWLLHESEVHKQQVPKLTSSRAEDLDRQRGPLPAAYRTAGGYHVAPQGPAGSLANARMAAALPHRPVVTMDILSDRFIDASLYAGLEFLDHLTAFMPSESEIVRIWRPSSLEDWLREQAVAHDCHMVAKLGEKGALVCEARTARLTHVPACVVGVVDTTGAGDAFCGGFVAGLVQGRPLAECAALGTVSASYVVESCGALAAAQPDEAGLGARMRDVLRRAETVRA